jgi:hypothetical protein
MIFSLKKMNLAVVMEGKEARKEMIACHLRKQMPRNTIIDKSLYRSFCQEMKKRLLTKLLTLPSAGNGSEVTHNRNKENSHKP